MAVLNVCTCAATREHGPAHTLAPATPADQYSKDSGLYDGENKKVIGKFKDESPDEVIESFVGIRSKCYSFITKNNVVKKAKGVSKVVKYYI